MRHPNGLLRGERAPLARAALAAPRWRRMNSAAGRLARAALAADELSSMGPPPWRRTHYARLSPCMRQHWGNEEGWEVK